MNPDMAAGAALVAVGVAGLVAGFVVTWVALRRTGHTTGQVEPLRSVSAPLPATARPLDDDLSVADGIDDLARVARAAGVWVEDEDGAR